LFFDRPKVTRAVDKAKRQALSRAGAFIRTTARSSIRKRKTSAPPGRPPHSHTGLLKRFIFFGYDPATDSVVVGPVGFKRSNAPNVLEFGGTTVVERRTKGTKRRRRVRIGARPFMGPALEKERPKFPVLWRNSVRGG
jgi:phage gpG-like protein